VSPVIFSDPKQADAVELNLRFVPNQTIVTSAHMQATNKMGSSEVNSVVSRDFRVWGTTNLYVVDGSVFPTPIAANPIQSVYTFARSSPTALQRARSSHEVLPFIGITFADSGRLAC
jgi:choline dehydrogenase-like flavoprotein